MAKTLKSIISELSTDFDGLKNLNKQLQTAKDEEKAAPEDASKKKMAEEKQSEFDKKRSSITKAIKDKVREAIENEKLQLYSEEVRARRKNRSVANIEQEINKTQMEMDVLTLEINSIDKDIEAARLGLSTAPVKATT